jgi:uncharacterized protein (UPF0548 family)
MALRSVLWPSLTQQQASDNLQSANEVRCEVGKGNAKFSEAAHALVGIDELQNAFPEEDASRHQTQQQG